MQKMIQTKADVSSDKPIPAQSQISYFSAGYCEVPTDFLSEAAQKEIAHFSTVYFG